MRRSMIVTLFLLGITVSMACAVSLGIFTESDQIEISENAIYGNSRAANGLRVQLHTTYEDVHFWDTTFTVGGTATTKYTYSQDDFYKYKHEGKGISMKSYIGDGTRLESSLESSYAASPGSLESVCKELYDSIRAGEEASKEIYIKDYLDYYGICVITDFMDQNSNSGYANYPEENGDTFLRCFKLPVLQEETAVITVRKNQNGTLDDVEIKKTDRDAYSLAAESEQVDQDCYFTFDTHTKNNNVIDTSQLTKGYGIYHLSCRDPFNADTLSVVYPLDPSVKVLSLDLNEEKTKLLLYTVENKYYYLTVIDIETMNMVQKLKVAEWVDGADRWDLYDKGDIIAMKINLQKLIIITLAEDGVYQKPFDCMLKEADAAYLEQDIADLAWDGEKIAVAGYLKDDTNSELDSYNFYLAIYDESGLIYYGEYKNSLDTGKLLEDEFYESMDNSLEISW